jgi:hypothetical protein
MGNNSHLFAYQIKSQNLVAFEPIPSDFDKVKYSKDFEINGHAITCKQDGLYSVVLNMSINQSIRNTTILFAQLNGKNIDGSDCSNFTQTNVPYSLFGSNFMVEMKNNDKLVVYLQSTVDGSTHAGKSGSSISITSV